MAIQRKRCVDNRVGRAELLEQILKDTIPELANFVGRAEHEKASHQTSHSLDKPTALTSSVSASHKSLRTTLGSTLEIGETGSSTEGLHETLQAILKYSINTSSPGFLDKLYAAPLPPGIAAELILSVLNTNLHVYQVSPVLTIIEKDVTKKLAHMFGLNGLRSGGISVQGGSASNMTSIVIARNTLFPTTKAQGNSAVNGRLILFTSEHGHYSIEKAAQALGLGSSNVISVPVDKYGRMSVTELRRLISETKSAGHVPFYINATAGSTVLGSFDPFKEIAQVAKDHGLWLHVDAAWGGGFVFSHKAEVRQSLEGIELADSIATNPHKMLGVPLTCSFLLGKDLKQFQDANTLKAGYLFHDDLDDEVMQSRDLACHESNAHGDADDSWDEPYDLADLTLQCGRRGDSLKLFFSWKFYGTKGYSDMVDNAHELAYHMSELVQGQPNLRAVLAGSQKPSCLQVCFYYTPGGKFVYGLLDEPGHFELSTDDGLDNANGHVDKSRKKAQLGKRNSRVTARVAKELVPKGFMIDFAPALKGQEDKGSFFRVVVNISTIRETVERLVEEIVAVGDSVVTNLRRKDGLTSSEI